jgi:hypothetical protein
VETQVRDINAEREGGGDGEGGHGDEEEKAEDDEEDHSTVRGITSTPNSGYHRAPLGVIAPHNL